VLALLGAYFVSVALDAMAVVLGGIGYALGARGLGIVAVVLGIVAVFVGLLVGQDAFPGGGENEADGFLRGLSYERVAGE